jgi:hypothetical protein
MKCPKCGSLIGGTKLNGKYRYYRCRGSVPTITRDKICNAGYIKADELEEAIWNKIIDMLSNPLTILKTLTDEKHQDPNDVVILLNDQIEKLRKKLKSYPSKEKNLYNLLSNEAVTKDYVLDTVTKLKQERLIDEQQLQDLLNSRNEATQSNRLRLKLSQVSFNKLSELIYDLEWKGFDPIIDPDDEEAPCLEVDDLKKLLERKRNFLESIRLAVVADPQNYQFNITLDGKIISTKDNDELISFNDELKNFEKQHPDISVKDLLDENKPIPEHTLFAEKVNQLKQNLVTIEQTSG